MTTKLVATGAFLAFLASASIALAEDKVTLCHVTESDSNPFVLITVSSNAVPAHVSHGDFIAPIVVEARDRIDPNILSHAKTRLFWQ